MEYRERLPEEYCKWVQSRIRARGEEQNQWCGYLGMSKHMFSKILHRVKPLPEKYYKKWDIMEGILKGDEPYEGF